MRPVLFFAVLVVLFTGSATIVSADEKAYCDRISVNGSNEWYPFAYRDRQGQARGVGFVVMAAVAEYLDVKLEISLQRPWKRNIAKLKAAKLDVIAGAYWDRKRARDFKFTVPFAWEDVHLFIRRADQEQYDGVVSLRGTNGVKPLGMSMGHAFELQLAPYVNVVENTDYEAMIRMVQIGRADWFGLAYHNGVKRIRDMGLEAELVPLNFSIARNGVHFMLPGQPRCPHLQLRINQAIAALRESGQLSRIIADEVNMALGS